MYDMILVDEAQDFSKYFLRMCYMSLPQESRMLVYAYDELQSLDNKSVASPEEMFGSTDGKPNVVLEWQGGGYRIIEMLSQFQAGFDHGAQSGIWRIQRERNA